MKDDCADGGGLHYTLAPLAGVCTIMWTASLGNVRTRWPRHREAEPPRLPGALRMPSRLSEVQPDYAVIMEKTEVDEWAMNQRR
jgi:hypothetical protein